MIELWLEDAFDQEKQMKTASETETSRFYVRLSIWGEGFVTRFQLIMTRNHPNHTWALQWNSLHRIFSFLHTSYRYLHGIVKNEPCWLFDLNTLIICIVRDDADRSTSWTLIIIYFSKKWNKTAHTSWSSVAFDSLLLLSLRDPMFSLRIPCDKISFIFSPVAVFHRTSKLCLLMLIIFLGVVGKHFAPSVSSFFSPFLMLALIQLAKDFSGSTATCREYSNLEVEFRNDINCVPVDQLRIFFV